MISDTRMADIRQTARVDAREGCYRIYAINLEQSAYDDELARASGAASDVQIAPIEEGATAPARRAPPRPLNALEVIGAVALHAPLVALALLAGRAAHAITSAWWAPTAAGVTTLALMLALVRRNAIAAWLYGAAVSLAYAALAAAMTWPALKSASPQTLAPPALCFALVLAASLWCVKRAGEGVSA